MKSYMKMGLAMARLRRTYEYPQRKIFYKPPQPNLHFIASRNVRNLYFEVVEIKNRQKRKVLAAWGKTDNLLLTPWIFLGGWGLLYVIID